ncbi:MAG: glycosyltransferase family 9 protein [Candidatus Fermentibacteraceae bacterium]
MNCSSQKTDFLLVRLHSLGDVVLAAPAARAAAALGSAAFLTRTAFLPVVRRFQGGVNSIGCDGGFLQLLRATAGHRTGKIVDLQNNISTRLAFPCAKRFHFDRAKRRRIIALGQNSGEMPCRSEAFLNAAGFPDADPEPGLERYAGPPNDCFSVGMVTGGRWPLKALPEAIVAELARLFCDLEGARVYLIGDRSDRQEAEGIRVSCGNRRVLNVCGEGDVGSLLSRLEGLDLLISPDSGPGHLARGLGVPTLVVFTSTSQRLGFWKRSSKGYHEVPGVPCRPCHRHGGRECPLGVAACRTRLVPREIHDLAMGLVK